MNVIYFENGFNLIIKNYIVETSFYIYQENKIYITGLCNNVIDFNEFKQLIIDVIDDNLYYINYDNENHQAYFILKSYHCFIESNHIPLLLISMENIDDIYLKIFEDFLINNYHINIEKHIDNDNKIIYLTSQKEQDEYSLFDYCSIISNKNMEIFYQYFINISNKFFYKNNRFYKNL